MSKYVIEDTTLTSIANAIREKTGSNDAIAVDDMANQIIGITSTVDNTPSISVSDSGLITATSGSKTVTKQLSNVDDTDFVSSNIVAGRTIFGVNGSTHKSFEFSVSTTTPVNELVISLGTPLKHLGVLTLMRSYPVGGYSPLSVANVCSVFQAMVRLSPGGGSAGYACYFPYFPSTNTTSTNYCQQTSGFWLSNDGKQITIKLPSGYYFDFPNGCGNCIITGY